MSATTSHVTSEGGRSSVVARWVERPAFRNVVIGLIVFNALILGLETNRALVAEFGAALNLLEACVVGAFVLELALKLYAYRLRFFRSGWNNFDFVVVAISLVPAAGVFSALRTLRIFRVLRLLSVVPQLRYVINGLFAAIPAMSSILVLLVVVFYVGAVMTTQLFGGHPELAGLFGSLGASMYSLFQLITLDGWQDNIAGPTMIYFPWAWAFFIPFIVITSFAVLNLFIGIIVDSLQLEHAAQTKADYDTASRRSMADSAPSSEGGLDDVVGGSDGGIGVRAAAAEEVRGEAAELAVEVAALRAELAEVKALLIAARPERFD